MKSIEKLNDWIKKSPMTLSGTIREVRMVCGKKTCKCRHGKDADKHGPYYLWDRKVDGKLTSTSIPKDQLTIIKNGIKNREKVQDIITQILAESEELAKKLIKR